jgi:hypothetical protein
MLISSLVRSTFLGLCCLAAGHGLPAAETAVFWASDPVRPGETAMVVGEGFGPSPVIEVGSLDDGPAQGASGTGAFAPGNATRVKALQASEQTLKFVVSEELKPGVMAVRISGRGQPVLLRLNAPQIWWAQGDLGQAASPGAWVRLLGKNLGTKPKDVPGEVRVRLEGPRTLSLQVVAADEFSAKVALPSDLPPGPYKISAHNGRGGAAAWSEPILVRVEPASPWPSTVFSVKEFGAEGDGVKDDTRAVRAALQKAGQNGGGVVSFPAGRYRLSGGLTVPRATVLRGEKCEWTCLAWTDLPKPPDALVKGTNSFGIEDLTLYAQNYQHVIAGDLGDQPSAGNVFLRRVRVRANVFRGHPTPEQVDQRFRESLRLSTGGGDTVRLGGPNVEISDCDLYGSGRALFLSRAKGGRVSGNKLSNGRWGWYCISGSDGLIFEDNALTGGDLMSTGGGLNCLDGSTYSQNVYFAHNRLSMMHGWDREAMTSDAGGDAYLGKVRATQGTTLTLASEPKWEQRSWIGAGVFILDGRGAGQHRRIARHAGTTVELDRPWAAEPDATSELCITMYQGRYLLVDNEFVDTGAMQFFGTSIECIVAGNRGTRMQGFQGLGLWYHGYQPSWYCQFLDNAILEGNYYHWDSAALAVLQVAGASHPPYQGPLNRGSVVRRNWLHSNAQVRVAGTVRDAIVEGNRVQRVEQGIFVSRDSRDVLLRNNQFQDVKLPVVDEEAVRKAAEERMKRFLHRREPVAAWTMDAIQDGAFADAAGNGFDAGVQGGVSTVAAGVRGQAARFDGKSCLRVEEPAVFNAPDITVALWIKPATVSGRRGLVAKRFGGSGAPLVLSQQGAAIGFEACDENGKWVFNFASPDVLKADQWTHVAAVVRRGEGITLFADGRPIAQKKIAADRAPNNEPLVLGREAWGGDPPKGDTPGFFVGLMDEVRVWTRSLTPAEVEAEHAAGRLRSGK